MSMVSLPPTAHFAESCDDSIAATVSHPDGATLAQGVIAYCEYTTTHDWPRCSTSRFPRRVFRSRSISFRGPRISPQPAMTGPAPFPSGRAPTITVFVQDDDAYPLTLSPNVVAEAAEIFMIVQKRWNPGWSCGEALSRVCVQILYPPLAPLASTGSDWFSAATHQTLRTGSTRRNQLIQISCRSAAARCFSTSLPTSSHPDFTAREQRSPLAPGGVVTRIAETAAARCRAPRRVAPRR